MRRSLACLALLATTGVLTACGSNTTDDRSGQTALDGAVEAFATVGDTADEAQDAAVAQVTYDECRTSVDPLLESLQTINSRLSVGINQATYGELIGGASVAYDQNIDAILDSGQACLRAASKLEDAYNLHAKVLNEWGECIEDYYNCDFNTGAINDRTQDRWLQTSTLVDQADRILERSAP